MNRVNRTYRADMTYYPYRCAQKAPGHFRNATGVVAFMGVAGGIGPIGHISPIVHGVRNPLRAPQLLRGTP